MYVKDNMTYNPITIGPNNSISEALDIMSENNLHRLPVVDGKGKLIGLVTEGIISSNSPSSASTLSVFEINYLLNKLTIADIMIKDVVTIYEDALLEEAATVLRKYNIGCLPVVDEDNNLLGIITHNDIFSAFIDLLGYSHKGTRYVINVTQDKPGVLADIAKCFYQNAVSISNLAVYHTSRGIEVVVISYDYQDISAALSEAGYKVSGVLMLHKDE